MIGGGNDNLYRHACDALGKPEWKDDPRFLTNALRVKHRDELIPMMTEVTKTRTTHEWLEHFEGRPFPYAAVNDVLDSLNHPHTIARNMVVTVDHPTCGPIKLVNTPVKYSKTQPDVRKAPPTLGQHTNEILSEIGLSSGDIDSLRSSGIVA
jgi:succinate--hydroxymethylglutarate CoA-transferase